MNWKAVILGALSYPLLWLIWSVFSPEYAHKSTQWYSLFFDLFYMLMPALSGYLAGYLAKTRGLQHGALVGALVVAMSLVFWVVADIVDFSSLSVMLFQMASMLVLAMAGGALSQWRYYLKS